MSILVTGSAGHLGEALVQTLRAAGREVVSLDIRATPFTDHVGTIADRDFVRRCMKGVGTVLHPATLHKPHVATHSRQDFVDTNITGTLNLLEEAVAAKVRAFIFTSTTSVFGDAMAPPPGKPAVWIDEDVVPVPKNIYGATKRAAEDLCQLAHRNQGLNCLILRTSRFFPEADDDKDTREAYPDANLKTNEFLYRRADIEDVVSAHLLAIEKAPVLGFGRYIVSATSPFVTDDLALLRADAPRAVARHVPGFEADYKALGWRMFPSIDRVYSNVRARRDLGWRPKHDFASVLARAKKGEPVISPLAAAIGVKGYHPESFPEGPYPVE